MAMWQTVPTNLGDTGDLMVGATAAGISGASDEHDMFSAFLQLYCLLLCGGIVQSVACSALACWEKATRGSRLCNSSGDTPATDANAEAMLAKSAGVRHIAVAMDGNRRFGKREYGDALRGHRDGADALVRFMNACMDEGVEILTVYAFSTENWSRPPREVDMLMGLIVEYADEVCRKAVERGARVRVLASDATLLPPRVRSELDKLEAKTAENSEFLLNLCISYGGRGDIVAAARNLAEDVAAGRVMPGNIDDAAITSRLTTSGMPDPDILLRTSGELRLSNFLLWQCAYSELFFLEKLWPEVDKDDVRKLLIDYSNRRRRFGK